MSPKKAAAQRLAQIVTGCNLEAVTIEDTAATTSLATAIHIAVGEKRTWVRTLAAAIVAEFHGKRPSWRRLTEFILANQAFARRWRSRPLWVVVDFEVQPGMRPASGRPIDWPVPAIETIGELAKWLNLEANELNWFADIKSLEEKAGPKLIHYRRHWEQKRDGTFRLIEAPKQRLRLIQRAILSSILERIPTHEAAHGFRRGRSILSFSSPHSGQAVVIKLDLRDFFPTFSFARVQNLLLTAGYPERVARHIAGLCTTCAPGAAIRELPRDQQRRARDLYMRKHLAQGAPTSPALANLCAFNLDCRLAGLARAAGGNYTRYADDLAFSGGADFARNVGRFVIHAMAIALEEGFEINARKTRIMRQGVAQRAAGLTLNVKPNICRGEYDRLKAILTNCARHGPAVQNREGHPDFRSHLQGRVSHINMVSPTKGRKLQALFEKINWGGAE
jgi:RNA-directed DNA polymerase